MIHTITTQSFSSQPDLKLEGGYSNKGRVRFLIKRKFRKSTGRRFLGPLWLVLDPLIFSLIYLFVFTVVKARIEASSIFIGVTLYRVLQSSLLSGSNSLSDHNGGLRCERITDVVMMKANLGHLVIDVLIRTIPTAFILSGGFDISIFGSISYLLIAQLMGFLVYGLGMSVSGAVRRVPDFHQLIRYALMMGFYISPAMIPMYKMNGLHYTINQYNPFTYFVEAARFMCDIDSVFEDLGLELYFGLMFFLIFATMSSILRYRRLRWRISSWS